MKLAVLFATLMSAAFCIPDFAADSNTVISSDQTTNWGSWGSVQYCPKGKFVIGMKLKTEPHQGSVNNDDTALNTIQLYCGQPGANSDTSSPITSKMGFWGKWGPDQWCRSGVATGFQLRAEPPQGGGDDAAANNFNLHCVGPNGAHIISGNGQSWGDWQSVKQCYLAGQAICGIQTQVEDFCGIDCDDTALNNVKAICCDIMDYKCDAHDKFQLIETCINLGSNQMSCEYSEATGFQKVDSSSYGQTWSWANSQSFGVGMGVVAINLSEQFSSTIGYSKTTGYDWSVTTHWYSAWLNNKTFRVSQDVPPGSTLKIYQAVGICRGIVLSRPAYFKFEESNVNLDVPIVKYFTSGNRV